MTPNVIEIMIRAQDDATRPLQTIITGLDSLGTAGGRNALHIKSAFGAMRDHAGALEGALNRTLATANAVINALQRLPTPPTLPRAAPTLTNASLLLPTNGERAFAPDSPRVATTYNVIVQLPAEAMASPERARAAGEAYGDGFMQQVRRQGGLG